MVFARLSGRQMWPFDPFEPPDPAHALPAGGNRMPHWRRYTGRFGIPTEPLRLAVVAGLATADAGALIARAESCATGMTGRFCDGAGGA